MIPDVLSWSAPYPSYPLSPALAPAAPPSVPPAIPPYLPTTSTAPGRGSIHFAPSSPSAYPYGTHTMSPVFAFVLASSPSLHQPCADPAGPSTTPATASTPPPGAASGKPPVPAPQPTPPPAPKRPPSLPPSSTYMVIVPTTGAAVAAPLPDTPSSPPSSFTAVHSPYPPASDAGSAAHARPDAANRHAAMIAIFDAAMVLRGRPPTPSVTGTRLPRLPPAQVRSRAASPPSRRSCRPPQQHRQRPVRHPRSIPARRSGRLPRHRPPV